MQDREDFRFVDIQVLGEKIAVADTTQMRGLEKGDRVRFTFIQEDEGPRIETIGRAGQ